MVGRPIQIAVRRDDNSFEFNGHAFASVLLQDHVKDKNVVVISVAGAFTKGKSFLLEFFLRYLATQGNYVSINSDYITLGGSSWPEDSKRDNACIHMWSEVFVARLSNMEPVAIIIMETRGDFDSEIAARDCATVFTLTTLLSSVQLYTLSRNIQQRDLQQLQLITEYGRIAVGNDGYIPLQKLHFVVNDWNLPYDARCGARGGAKLLNRRLQVPDKQHPQTQSIRKYMRSCFCDTSCFLMPPQGIEMATRPVSNLDFSDLDPAFRKKLQRLVTMTLAPEELVVKEICGHKVKAKELIHYFNSYCNIFKGGNLPGPKTVLLATHEANILATVIAAMETYTLFMEGVCRRPNTHLKPEYLEAQHQKIKDRLLRPFVNEIRNGCELACHQYEMIDNELNDLYGQFRMLNEPRDFRRVIAIVFCILFCIFVHACISCLDSAYNLLMESLTVGRGSKGFLIVGSAIWACYSSRERMRVMGAAVANVMWHNVLKPTWKHFPTIRFNGLLCWLKGWSCNTRPYSDFSDDSDVETPPPIITSIDQERTN
jgi:atlastin